MDVCLHPRLNQTQERTVSPGYGGKQSSGDAVCTYYLCIHLHSTPYVYFLEFFHHKNERCSIISQYCLNNPEQQG